jgi:hypothetical protein
MCCIPLAQSLWVQWWDSAMLVVEWWQILTLPLGRFRNKTSCAHNLITSSCTNSLCSNSSRDPFADGNYHQEYYFFLTVLVQMTLVNGILLKLPSLTLSLFTLCVLWMVGSYLNFTFAIQQIGATTQSTNTIGFSIMVGRTSHIQPFPPKHILFVHPICPTTMLDATTFCHFGNGLHHAHGYIHSQSLWRVILSLRKMCEYPFMDISKWWLSIYSSAGNS